MCNDVNRISCLPYNFFLEGIGGGFGHPPGYVFESVSVPIILSESERQDTRSPVCPADLHVNTTATKFGRGNPLHMGRSVVYGIKHVPDPRSGSQHALVLGYP